MYAIVFQLCMTKKISINIVHQTIRRNLIMKIIKFLYFHILKKGQHCENGFALMPVHKIG